MGKTVASALRRRKKRTPKTMNDMLIDAYVAKFNSAGALAYATYLGGSGIDEGLGVVLDDAANAYATGFTASSDFPTTPGAVDTTLGGAQDAYVTKLNATGSALVYSSYLGGGATDQAGAIALDSAGSAYVAGITGSKDFPTTPGAFDTTLAGRSATGLRCGDSMRHLRDETERDRLGAGLLDLPRRQRRRIGALRARRRRFLQCLPDQPDLLERLPDDQDRFRLHARRRAGCIRDEADIKRCTIIFDLPRWIGR